MNNHCIYIGLLRNLFERNLAKTEPHFFAFETASLLIQKFKFMLVHTGRKLH